jgi:hypothetical protein
VVSNTGATPSGFKLISPTFLWYLLGFFVDADRWLKRLHHFAFSIVLVH